MNEINFIYIHLFPQDFSDNNVKNPYMENYVYNELPDYFLLSIHNTRISNVSSNIYFLTNTNYLNNDISEQLSDLNVILVNYNDLQNNRIKYICNNFYTDIFNKLTFLRFVFCEQVMIKYNLSNFMYVEGDNFIFTNIKNISFDNDSLYICGPVNINTWCSNIIFCNSLEKISELNNISIELINKNIQFSDMNIFRYCPNLFKTFNQLFDDEYIFDPAGWGFYFIGDNHGRKNPYFDDWHIVSQFIKHNINDIKFNTDLSLEYNYETYKFASLHLANKSKIKDFLTNEIYRR